VPFGLGLSLIEIIGLGGRMGVIKDSKLLVYHKLNSHKTENINIHVTEFQKLI